ncbi:MAG: hypothetical protein ACYC0M_10700 [Burkholderiales bacterium]
MRINSTLPLLIYALFASVLAGCGSIQSVQTGRFTALSTATLAVDSSASDTFARIEQDTRNNAILTAPNANINIDTFRMKAVNGESYDLSGSLQKVLASLNVLVQYSKALQNLAGEDVGTGIDKSTQDLAASVKGLKVSNINADEVNAFAAIVDELARVATESERKSKLRDVMTKAQPAVEQLANETTKVTEKLKSYVVILENTYINHANTDRPVYGTWARYQFDQQVAAQLSEFDKITAALDSTNKEIQGFPDTNEQLLQALDNPQQSLDALHDFISEAQHLRTFYRALPTK